MTTPKPSEAARRLGQAISDVAHGPQDEAFAEMVALDVDAFAHKAAADARREAIEDYTARRGVETPCPKCYGLGTYAYGSTAMWAGGTGGQSITTGPCDECWGSGDATMKWLNLRLAEIWRNRALLAPPKETP